VVAETPEWETTMTDRTYVLAIDASCGFADLERIRAYVTTSDDFSSWWNHIPMVFMLESRLNADAIGERLHALAPDARFLLTGVNLTESQGWLPELSWKWIEKRALAATPLNSARF
jgi:hypothetical protein